MYTNNAPAQYKAKQAPLPKRHVMLHEHSPSRISRTRLTGGSPAAAITDSSSRPSPTSSASGATLLIATATAGAFSQYIAASSWPAGLPESVCKSYHRLSAKPAPESASAPSTHSGAGTTTDPIAVSPNELSPSFTRSVTDTPFAASRPGTTSRSRSSHTADRPLSFMTLVWQRTGSQTQDAAEARSHTRTALETRKEATQCPPVCFDEKCEPEKCNRMQRNGNNHRNQYTHEKTATRSNNHRNQSLRLQGQESLVQVSVTKPLQQRSYRLPAHSADD